MRFLLSLLAGLVAGFCLAGSPAHADRVDITRLDQRIKRMMSEEKLIGLAIAVVEEGETTFAKGYGVTHSGGIPVTVETKFRWASVSKGVASSLLGLLDYEGQLSLADPVSDFSTTLRLPGGSEATATISDVLSHQLGLVSNAYDTRLEDGRDPADIRKSFATLDLICPVGTCHTYQNVAFDAVAEIAEDAVGFPYEALVSERLFVPLGMARTSFGFDALVGDAGAARGHIRTRRNGPYLPDRLKPNYYRVPAAAGVNSSILDFARFMTAQMGRYPDVLPQSVLDVIHAPLTETGREQRRMNRNFGRVSDAHYGLGWRTYDYAGHRVVGHRGGANGFRSLMLFDPERDSGIVVLWNSTHGAPVGLQFEVMDMIYGLEPVDWIGLEEES